MSNIIYEPTSVRDDHGILVIMEGIPVTIPVIFEIPTIDENNEKGLYKIKASDYVEISIKADIRLIDCIIHKTITGITDNTALLNISAQEHKLLRGGNTYYMGVCLYDKDHNPIRQLIHNLPIRVQRSV